MTRDEAKQWIMKRFGGLPPVGEFVAENFVAEHMATIDSMSDAQFAEEWGTAEDSPFIRISHDGEGSVSITGEGVDTDELKKAIKEARKDTDA